ncbi:unnamed protein product [Symbiodinium sp. CCMP2592]|nr:unnamed protein product [Symbiodinium sp. CCMP2592]
MANCCHNNEDTRKQSEILVLITVCGDEDAVQFAPWRMFAPVYLITLLYAGFSFPAAALLAVLLPSMVFELSVTWRTALAVIVVSALSLRVAKEPGAAMAAKYFRDMARSRLGTLVYRSPRRAQRPWSN